ncbi:hypothetical protein GCM10027299_58250 [Larkinella ripae]
MKTILYALTGLLFSATTAYTQSTTTSSTPSKKMKFLIHVTQSEDPTRAALAFLVAKTALEEGHTVNLFLAGDGVKLVQEQVLNQATGVGTGKLRDHYDAIVKGNGRFFLSGNSAKARGMTEADLAGKPAEFALPAVLVRLATESDKVFTY